MPQLGIRASLENPLFSICNPRDTDKDGNDISIDDDANNGSSN